MIIISMNYIIESLNPFTPGWKVVGLLSLAMITDEMLKVDKISIDPLNELKVQDVMQTDFDKINFVQPQ